MAGAFSLRRADLPNPQRRPDAGNAGPETPARNANPKKEHGAAKQSQSAPLVARRLHSHALTFPRYLPA